nr:choice-of-anchor C family protein [Polymorphobacter sp.]
MFATAAAMLLAGSAQAATIVNGSFEVGISPGGFTSVSAGDSTSIAGWTVGGGGVDYIGSYWNASNGSRSVDLSGGAPGSVSQTFATIAGRTYTVSFDLSANPDNGPALKDFSASADNTTFLTQVGQAGYPLTWSPKGFTFTADDGAATLMFTSGAANSAWGPALDNVSVSLNAVPEPATWAMLIAGFGLVGVAARRRRSVVAA